MPRLRRFFPPEYKAEVVELIRSTGKTVGQVARELDLTETAVRQWVRQADLDTGRRSDGLTTAEGEELRRLRRENRGLREEREILRKAAQYTSLGFGRRLTDTGLVASMGTVGDALDNAVAESFFATLECELLDRHDWPTRQALRTAVFDFIEIFYNRQRRHSTLDYASPATYERQHTSPAPAA